MIGEVLAAIAQLAGIIVAALAVPVFLIGVSAIYEAIATPGKKARVQAQKES
jgi:hypothetical protein